MAMLGGKKLTELRVVDLREELNKRGLNKSGLKSVLIERLEESLLESSAKERLACEEDNAEDTDFNCNDCRKLSVEVTEAKMDLTLLWAKINSITSKPCECEILRKENGSLRLEVDCFRRKLIESENSKLHEIGTNNDRFKQRMQSQPSTIAENDSRETSQTQVTSENNSFGEANKVLEAEVRKLQEERDSLLLALRLVSTSSRMPDKAKVKTPMAKINQTRLQSKDQSPKSGKNNADKSKQEQAQGKSRNQNGASKKPVTVIAGDSIVQNVRGWELSSTEKVIVKSFSIATSEDMEDYLKPLLRKEPENLILHVGTNDLKTMEPAELANTIQSLAINVEENSPKTSVSISAIPPRKESQLSKNISVINNSLKLICRQHHWNFIEHTNIKQNHLNRGGIHLTKSGNDILANNFKLHINNE